MILLTVGTQLGFDRLVSAMDAITPTLSQSVIAQIGAGSYVPRHMQAQASFSPKDFEELAAKADLIVAHAGIGSVLTARRHNKPIVLLPRRADRHEHRNDHQLATAAQLHGRELIFVVENEGELSRAIEKALAADRQRLQSEPVALAQLKSAISTFIQGN